MNATTTLSVVGQSLLNRSIETIKYYIINYWWVIPLYFILKNYITVLTYAIIDIIKDHKTKK